MYWNETNSPETRDGFCGTVWLNEPTEEYESKRKGKTLFKENCATCHAINMKDDLTGPALGGSFARWNKDTLSYLKYLQDSNDSHLINNKRIINLKEEFPTNQSHHFKHLTLIEVKNIISYIEDRS